MFQPLEVTEARTIWIDSPGDDRLGFQDSSRVQIDRDPMGTGDFSETGEGFKVTLLGGMWPDDDELRLLVMGVVPGSKMADDYLNQLVVLRHKDIAAEFVKAGDTPGEITELSPLTEVGMYELRQKVQVMPSWSGQTERVIFVLPGLPRIKPETIKTAAVNNEPDRKLSFDMFRIQVDALLIARGKPATDTWDQSDMLVISNPHAKGVTPKEFVDNYMEKIDGRDQTLSQDTSA